MGGNRTLLLAAIACLFFPFPRSAWSEDAPSDASQRVSDALRVLRIEECKGVGLQEGESAAVQNLITSYVVELKMFRVIDSKGQELALREAETAVQLGVAKDISPLVADYVLASSMDSIGSQIVFSMDVVKASTG